MSNSHLDCQSLYQKVTQAFVDEILESDPLILRKIVRNIILSNIIQLRVSGQLATVDITKRDEWLIAYVRRVHDCYIHEHARWLSYRDPASAVQLYAELLNLIDKSSYRAKSMLEDRSEDILHDVYIQIRSTPDAYPYDYPLNDWICSLIQQAIDSEVSVSAAWIEDEQFEVDRGKSVSMDFWKADTNRWDDIIELRRWLSQQPILHQRIFLAFFNEMSAKQIAERFALTEGQVYRIVRKMRGQFKAYWDGESNN